MAAKPESGSASVEQAGLALLIAMLLLASAAALAGAPAIEGGREVGAAIARKLRCAPRLPGPCWQDPLTEAYGRSLGGAVRALAPAPAARGGLMPVDFRYCRSASCAVPGAGSRLTAANRRTTAFVSVEDGRRAGGDAVISYWLYRPTLGWESVRSHATSEQVTTLAATPLLESQDPALVPLETLAGRNHVVFPPGEEPPWRWRVNSAWG